MVVFSEKLGVNKKKSRMNLHSGFLSFRDEIDTYSLSEPVGRGPRESLHCKVLWGEGGMTERYEKSPANWLGFLNGA